MVRPSSGVRKRQIAIGLVLGYDGFTEDSNGPLSNRYNPIRIRAPVPVDQGIIVLCGVDLRNSLEEGERFTLDSLDVGVDYGGILCELILKGLVVHGVCDVTDARTAPYGRLFPAERDQGVGLGMVPVCLGACARKWP